MGFDSPRHRRVARDRRDGLLSPFLRKRRIVAALPYLRGRILDYGCGPGALAEYVPPHQYLGVDIDQDALDDATKMFPDHSFARPSDVVEKRFDSIAAIAVIEHLPSPHEFMEWACGRLQLGGRLILTTGLPQTDFLHDIGSRVFLLSQEAHEEHVSVIGKKGLLGLATDQLESIKYRRFLWGLNQLVVYELTGVSSQSP